jgi:hypothetical protein
MIKVNGAWYLDSLPQHIVMELTDGSLTKVFLTPFRPLSEKDFTVYKAYHPRKCKGQPLPDYLYRFYGLEKSDKSATEVIHIRMTPTEKVNLQTAADGAGKNISEFVRDWVKTL